MAELTFFTGAMDSGKSTLALQTNHNRRAVELADRTQILQVEALCWCGKRATHNARLEDGVMVTEGEVIVVGDTGERAPAPGRVSYEVLCRQHHRRSLTAESHGGQREGLVTSRRMPDISGRG